MRLRLALALSIIIILIVVACSSFTFSLLKEEVLNDHNKARQTVLENLAISAYQALLKEDFSSITFIAEEFIKNPEVVSLVIIDREGRVIYDSLHKTEGDLLSEGQLETMIRTVELEGRELSEITVPFKIGGRAWTSARASYSMASINLKIRELLNRILIICLAGVLAGVLSSYFLAKWIMSPLKKLRTGINAVIAGDLGHRVSVGGDDEIEEIQTKFNLMAGHLKEAKERFESTISALEETNTKLREVQADLLEKEKLSAVVELAGAAAHEINQPLMVVMGNIEIILSETEIDREKLRKTLTTINRSAREIAEIVQKMGSIKRIKKTQYIGKINILDIDKSSKA